jgi:hypothetical protein
MLYEEVFRSLMDREIRYAVAGGIALVLHGVVRLTADLDLVIELTTENLTRFISVMNDLGYEPKQPVKAEELINSENRKRWEEEKEMKVFSFFHPARPMNLIDVFINEPISFDEIEKELVVFESRGIRIPVVSKRHLKTMKMATQRPQDIADIAALDDLERM